MADQPHKIARKLDSAEDQAKAVKAANEADAQAVTVSAGGRVSAVGTAPRRPGAAK